MKYKTVYSFDVFAEVTKGRTIWMLDRKRYLVLCVNEMSMGDFADITKSAEPEQLEFWYEVKEEKDA